MGKRIGRDEPSGSLDVVRYDVVTGWVRGPYGGAAAVVLLDGAEEIARIEADLHRSDLRAAGIGDGRHGFEFRPREPLARNRAHALRALRASDGLELPGSPRNLDARAPRDGRLDRANPNLVEGWASDGDRPCWVEVLVNGAVAATVLANLYRPDLAVAGIGDGRHAFRHAFPGGLDPSRPHLVEARRRSDGLGLAGSPVAIGAADEFESPLRSAITRAVVGSRHDGSGGRHEDATAFLATSLAAMLRTRAEAEGDAHARADYAAFVRRWGDESVSAAPRDPGRAALVVDSRWPDPRRDAGSVAVLSHARSLVRLGYRVSMLAADEMGVAGGVPRESGIESLQAPVHGTAEEALRVRAGCFDLVYLHREENASRYLALARLTQPRARIVYSVADLHHLRVARQAVAENRPELDALAARLRLAECTWAWMADVVVTHSTAEADLLQKAVPSASVHVVPWDVPCRRPREALRKGRRDIAFIGSFAHDPNSDAVEWLASEILPAIRSSDPSIRCLLVGSGMTRRITTLRIPGLEAVGPVDDLTTEVFDRVATTIAPLRWGAGIKGKVLESMAAGVPCAMTPIAAEGLGLSGTLSGLVAADAAGLARVVLAMRDPARNVMAAREGLGHIAANHSPAVVDRAMTAALGLGTTVSGDRNASRTGRVSPRGGGASGRPGRVSQ